MFDRWARKALCCVDNASREPFVPLCACVAELGGAHLRSFAIGGWTLWGGMKEETPSG